MSLVLALALLVTFASAYLLRQFWHHELAADDEAPAAAAADANDSPGEHLQAA